MQATVFGASHSVHKSPNCSLIIKESLTGQSWPEILQSADAGAPHIPAACPHHIADNGHSRYPGVGVRPEDQGDDGRCIHTAWRVLTSPPTAPAGSSGAARRPRSRES